MENRADIIVNNRDNEPILMVEVKTKLHTSPDWVAQYRRNIFSHGDLPSARFFLFAFPDRFYLWTHNSDPHAGYDPDSAIDARPILGPYFERADVLPEKIRGESFELLIWWWLADVVHDDWNPANPNVSRAWLMESGLAEAIRNGRVLHEVLA